MRPIALLCSLCLLISACQPAPGSAPLQEPAATLPSKTAAEALPATATSAPTATRTSQPTRTPTPAPSATSTVTPEPEGTIHVDTLAQEVFPFDENGQCSLGEAIYAANLQKTVDTCAAGGPVGSVIVLMPGTYRLTQLDATGQQVDWAYSTTGTGNALPAVVRTLTLRGNGAVLSREAASEPFRILEVLYGVFTIENITLQGGEVNPEDWGGAMLVEGADELVMDGVTVKNSKAENGGGVYVGRSGLTIRNSTFDNNEALFTGGACMPATLPAKLPPVPLPTTVRRVGVAARTSRMLQSPSAIVSSSATAVIRAAAGSICRSSTARCCAASFTKTTPIFPGQGFRDAIISMRKTSNRPKPTRSNS